MCTAITYKTKDHYFGRNLDLDYSYQETVTIMPRNYELHFKNVGTLEQHFAMIGMAYVVDDYPLYYDGMNEYGLAMAGLNFPGNAYYGECTQGMDNIAPHEFIPWILAQCKTIAEARGLLQHMNLVNESFQNDLPVAPLHFILSDQEKSISIEPTKEKLNIYENKIGVLTNNPGWDYHLYNLSNYLNLSEKQPGKCFGGGVTLDQYTRGLGAVGLPGDWSSPSRFVRGAFVKSHSLSDDSEQASVNQFFHILDSVAHPRGCVEVESGKYQYTIYSCCCNQEKGIYYYTTYENREVIGVDMYQEDLSGVKLISYPLKSGGAFYIQNKIQTQDASQIIDV